jgi:hypothetical protein
MVHELYFPYVIVFPMHNYNHDVGFHVGIKGKASHGGLASWFKVEVILGGKGGSFDLGNGGDKKVDNE